MSTTVRAIGTEAELTQLMASRPWLRQIKHQVSCGQSAAVRTGVRHARADVVVTLDGDGQNDPAFIPALFHALAAGAPRVGLVAGQRVGRQATGFKKFQSRLANGVRSAVLRDGTRDTGCGLKAFRRDLFLALPYFDGLAPVSAGAGPAGRLRRSAYVDVVDRPAPRRHVELRHVGSALDRHPRSHGRVVAHPPPAPRATCPGGETEC